jgi:hypothetical protein
MPLCGTRALTRVGIRGCTPCVHPSQVISWRAKAYRVPTMLCAARTQVTPLKFTWRRGGGCRCSIHRQDAHATRASAGAAEIIAVASGCSHYDIETAGGRDHGRVDDNRGLRTTVHRRGKGSAIKDDQGRRREGSVRYTQVRALAQTAISLCGRRCSPRAC